MKAERVGAVPRTREAGTLAVAEQTRQKDATRLALLGAVVDEVAELGYERASVAGISRRAGVEPPLFARHFRDKEECFLAACQLLADRLLRRARATLAETRTRTWPEVVRTALDAVLTYIAENPVEARACLVEGLAAGTEALAIRDLAMQGFGDLLNLFQDPDAGPRELVSEASVGGVYGIILRRIRDDQTETLPELLSSLSYFVVAPVVGGRRALRELSGQVVVHP